MDISNTKTEHKSRMHKHTHKQDTDVTNNTTTFKHDSMCFQRFHLDAAVEPQEAQLVSLLNNF